MQFVLVHGAYHGPWCWEPLIPELERRGHQALAVDMPMDDSGMGAADHAAVIAEQIGSLEDVVLVGHSMSGLIVPLVPDLRPVRRLVFLCAFVPRPGMRFNEVRAVDDIEPTVPVEDADWTDLGGGRWMAGPRVARQLFYHDLTPEQAAWAQAKLRPQAYTVMEEVTPLERLPDVGYTSILCRDDRAVSLEWGRKTAREQLGIEPIVLGGGHSPFLGRPAELAAALTRSRPPRDDSRRS